MSEYQYYEFRALDRPLNDSEMKELRNSSTRAEITSRSFTNVYHFGDFRGSPEEMMEKYFDAHVYYANWGTFTLMLRLPLGIIDLRVIGAYSVEDVLDFWTTGKHVIIKWCHFSEDGWDEWVEEDETWLDQLTPIREELGQGDYRTLYLGWLLGVQLGIVDKEADEPFIPSGGPKLTEAQKSLFDFLHIDVDLVSAGLRESKASTAGADREKLIKSWIDQIPEAEAKELLLRIFEGEPKEVQYELRRRYNQLVRTMEDFDPLSEFSGRTVNMLLERVNEEEKKRLAREAAKEAREQAERERKRREYLAELATKFPEIWQKADSCAQEKSGPGYDKARDLLVDLSDAYAQAGRKDEFYKLFKRFTEEHVRKPALLKRFQEAGLMA